MAASATICSRLKRVLSLQTAKDVLSSVSLEPVFFLFCVNLGLVMISSQDLYLSKACEVNLNYTREICNNRSHHQEVQEDVQQYVAEIQAYNGVLQSVPGVIFIIFAGPLSDTYGRKPLIIMALFGYLLLNLVFLANAFWFHELRVEYLLLECLQDLTGGHMCFYLAAYSYMVDSVHPASRTWRLSVLDSFMPLGFMVGLPLGTALKNACGPTIVFITGAVTVVIAMLYVLFFVKDNRGLVREGAVKPDTSEVLGKFPGCNRGILAWILEIVVSGLKTIFKHRPSGGRTWVICFVLVFCLSKGIDSGTGTVQYMFYLKQYKISNTDMSTLMSIGGPLMLVSQLFIIPFLSRVLKLRDTTILSLAVLGVIIKDLIVPFNSKLWVIYFSMSFGILHNTITTTSRSNLSKLMEEHEIGKAFSILGILQAALPVISKPAFAMLYKKTLKVFPATYLLVAASFYTGILGLLIYTHRGLKRRDGTVERERPDQLPEQEHLKREHL